MSSYRCNERKSCRIPKKGSEEDLGTGTGINTAKITVIIIITRKRRNKLKERKASPRAVREER